MTESAGRTKPYKLLPPLTRDSVCTWDYNQRAFTRHNKLWRPFLPPAGKHRTWTAGKADAGYGIVVNKEDESRDDEATEEMLANFEDFLTCLATHCPPNFFTTVMQESTSYLWVINKITETSSLDRRLILLLRSQP